MNPSPDRGKECLPPKKRESRQGSAEQHAPPDDFKPPVPLRSRPSAGRGEGNREAVDNDRALTNPIPHLLSSPPPLPTPAHTPTVPLPLPWPLAYSSVPLPLFPGQMSERRGPGSPSWREDPLSSTLPHHSRWLRGESPLTMPPSSSSSSSSSPSFKTPFPADSREMWSYLNSGRRDYNSSLFSPSHLFPFYPSDAGLAEVRHRYMGKRPNGLDILGSRTASTSRPLYAGDYGSDSSRVRLDVGGPHGSHTNGGRRPQDDLTGRIQPGSVFFSNSQAQEGHDIHSSLQDRDTHGLVKTSSNLFPNSPHRLGPDPRAGRGGGTMDTAGGLPAEAQVYYSHGSVYHHSPETQAYPPYSPSETPLYSMQREPAPRQHSLRNSPHSPLSLPNCHNRSQRDRERDQDKYREREREREREQERERGSSKDRDTEKDQEHDKDREQERDNERERQRDRERVRDRDRGREISHGRYSHLHASPPAPNSPPPALLPHFTKGSLIELANGRLKRVEELRTEDFLRSADTSPDFHLSTCTVLLIAPSSAHGFNHLQVLLTDRNTQELLKVLAEYPFFVRDRGWSSCCPLRTTQLYGLPCRQLAEGDVCLALTPTSTPTHRTHARTSSRAARARLPTRVGGELGGFHREEMPPPPPPPPLHPPPPPALPPYPAPTAADPPVEKPRLRKRRWSAPGTLPSNGSDETLPDLPHASKQMKRQ